MKLWRMIQARRHKVPFRKREWYNFRAHIRKEECPRYDFIEIFDDDGKYTLSANRRTCDIQRAWNEVYL